MRFSEKKMWKRTTTQKNHEEFLGTLRAKTTEETKDFLKAMLPVSRREIDGMVFETYPDGHIEVKSKYEIIKGMVKEI